MDMRFHLKVLQGFVFPVMLYFYSIYKLGTVEMYENSERIYAFKLLEGLFVKNVRSSYEYVTSSSHSNNFQTSYYDQSPHPRSSPLLPHNSFAIEDLHWCGFWPAVICEQIHQLNMFMKQGHRSLEIFGHF